MIKVVLITRHKLLESQKRAIEEANFNIVKVVDTVPTGEKFRTFVERLKELGVEGILTVALPPHLLSALAKVFRIFVFKMKALGCFPEEEARKLVEESPDRRVAIPPTHRDPDKWRVLQFEGIYEIKIKIEEIPLVTLP